MAHDSNTDRGPMVGAIHESPLHRRRSIRLQGYDYSQAGAYCVTVVTRDRACLFGNIANGAMRLNEAGQIAQGVWDDSPNHYADVALDAFVAMPNHVHGIVVITSEPVGAGSPRPKSDTHTRNTTPDSHTTTTSGAVSAPLPSRRLSLGNVVAYLKYQTTKQINELRQTPGITVWQRNYYKHIIRNEESLNRIREYIVNNPIQWDLDRENPVGAVHESPPQDGESPLQNEEPWRI